MPRFSKDSCNVAFKMPRPRDILLIFVVERNDTF